MNTFKELPWHPIRNDVKDFLDLSRERNMINAMSEVDVTRIYTLFEERKAADNQANSLITYLLWCYGQALKKHPDIQAMKIGKKLVLFDDVDVAMMIEKDLPNGKKQPFPYIFRGVQNKSYADLIAELKSAKESDLNTLVKKKKSLLIRWLPRFLRMYLIKNRLKKDPIAAKEVLGTVAMTSLGMVLKDRRFWPVPIGPFPCILASGATFTKRETDGEKMFLCITICLDHNLIDGAPGARFGQTLIDLMESAEGLV